MNVFTDTPQWMSLRARVDTQQVPHALLLSGPADSLMMGIGKMRFARCFAASLLCDARRTNTGAACGECSACHLFTAGSHGDYLQITPQEDSRVIKIHQIRALCEALGLTSRFGGYRVAIIEPADTMLSAAASGLLKMLEEPRPGVVIILVSAKIGAIPATVRSRCQRLRLNGLRDIRLVAEEDENASSYLSKWRDGLVPHCDYMSIAAEWSRADPEPIFREIFAWLSMCIQQGFTEDAHVMNRIGDGYGTCSRKDVKRDGRQWWFFYDKLLAAHQFAAKPGVNRRALYEQLFIEARALIPGTDRPADTMYTGL